MAAGDAGGNVMLLVGGPIGACSGPSEGGYSLATFFRRVISVLGDTTVRYDFVVSHRVISIEGLARVEEDS